MSLIESIVDAVTPRETEEARREAREQARGAATPGDWLTLVLEHHLEIEDAFAAVREAQDDDERREELQELSLVLTGHSNAEESVLYPALAAADREAHARMAYAEQATAKIEMAALESMPLMTRDFLEKLEHIRAAVAHHMYEEERTWFLELKAKGIDQARLTMRYMEEFERYVGGDQPLDDEDSGAPPKSLGALPRHDALR